MSEFTTKLRAEMKRFYEANTGTTSFDLCNMINEAADIIDDGVDSAASAEEYWAYIISTHEIKAGFEAWQQAILATQVKAAEAVALAKQQEFVAWLKEKGLYNEMASAAVMQHLQGVWEACNDE